MHLGEPLSAQRRRRISTIWSGIFILFGLVATFAVVDAARAELVPCSGGDVPPQGLRLGGGNAPGQQPDLLVTGTCTVRPKTNYRYANVNIVANGTLDFAEGANAPTDFYASSILIQNG